MPQINLGTVGRKVLQSATFTPKPAPAANIIYQASQVATHGAAPPPFVWNMGGAPHLPPPPPPPGAMPPLGGAEAAAAAAAVGAGSVAGDTVGSSGATTGQVLTFYVNFYCQLAKQLGLA